MLEYPVKGWREILAVIQVKAVEPIIKRGEIVSRAQTHPGRHPTVSIPAGAVSFFAMMMVHAVIPLTRNPAPSIDDKPAATAFLWHLP